MELGIIGREKRAKVQAFVDPIRDRPPETNLETSKDSVNIKISIFQAIMRLLSKDEDFRIMLSPLCKSLYLSNFLDVISKLSYFICTDKIS